MFTYAASAREKPHWKVTVMNSLLSSHKIRLMAAAIFIAAIGIFFWRPAPLAAPAPPVDFPEDNITHDKQLLSLEEATALFDLSALPKEPAPIVKAQPVDPTAAIQRHQLIGVTINKSGAIALVSDGASTFTLKQGDLLDGFVVDTIGPRRIEFKKGSMIAALDLPGASQ